MIKKPVYAYLGLFFLILGLSVSKVRGDSAEPPLVIEHSHWAFNDASRIPVQSGGRIKPLDSFAREMVLFETGTKKFQKWKSLDLLFSWISAPQFWENQAFIRVDREDVRKELGLNEKQSYFTPHELFHNMRLAQFSSKPGNDPAGGADGKVPPPSGVVLKENPKDKEIKLVLQRIGLFHGIISGQAWSVVPQGPSESWSTLVDSDVKGAQVRSFFVDLLKAYQMSDEGLFNQFSVAVRKNIEGEIQHFPDTYRIPLEAEVAYNQFRPFFLAWVFYLMAGLAWIACFWAPVTLAPSVKKIAFGLTGIGISSHIFGTLLRCLVAGRPPVTNMYESVIWVSLGIFIFAAVLYAVHRQAIILAVATFLSAFGLIAADAAPAVLDPSINPLVPVLRSNYWLTVHVLTITLGYAAFALTLGLANVTLFYFVRQAKLKKIQAINQLTYRAMQFGVVLIAAGTILGGIWADYSWGRFWGWDPKEVWALITLLCYLVILHGRYANWVGQFGFAAWSAVSFMSVVMAWYGVNFVLGSGLHSYGFASGGTPWVLGFVGIQLAYVLAVTACRSLQTKSHKIA